MINIWFLLERGWEKPEGDYDKWTEDELARSNWNIKGLITIFNGVFFVMPEKLINW